jgi:hypothetical protein
MLSGCVPPTCPGAQPPLGHALLSNAGEKLQLFRSHMKCPQCLASDRFVSVPNLIPGFLFPLRLFVGCVECDSCLRVFYRVRLFDWLIGIAAAPDEIV